MNYNLMGVVRFWLRLLLKIESHVFGRNQFTITGLSFFLWFLIFCPAVGAEKSEADSGVKELSKLLADLGASRGRFTQTTLSRDGEIIEQASGYFRVKSPSRLYWQYTEPFSQSIIMDGAILWLYDPDLEQVTRQALDEQSSGIPPFLLASHVDIVESYDISIDEGRRLSGWIWFDLVPKRRTNFDSISIGVTKQKIAKIELKDTIGQLTTVHFHGLETQTDFDDTEFEFMPPDGVEVIDALEGLNF